MIPDWTTDPRTNITSRRLTHAEMRAVKVLGPPRERGGIVELELDEQTLWGSLGGQVVNLLGLQLSPIVYPTYADARRAEIANALGVPVTAAEIDRVLADRNADNEVRS